jgi:predicted small lipoprotein YifL
MNAPSLSRRALALLFAIPFGAVTVAACGSRGPLQLDVVEVAADASSSVDAAADVAADTQEADVHEAGVADAPHEASLASCGQCVAQMCGQQVLMCLTDTTCRTTLQCVAQMCLGGGGGGLNFQCAVGCAGGDPSKLGGLIALFSCVTMTCGSDCTGALAGLGGGGGTRDGG